MRVARAAFAAAIFLTVTDHALAQQPVTRGFVSFNLALQEGPQNLSLAVPVEIFDTEGTLAVDDGVAGGAMLDFGGGLRRGGLAVGAGYSRLRVKDSHDLTASTNRFSPGSFQRVVNGTTPVLRHEEDTIYVFAGAVRSISDRFDVMVSGGPSFFRASQTVPTGIDVTNPFGAIRAVPTDVAKETTIGFHGALDLTYMVAPQFGVGGLVRYSWGSIDLPNGTEKMTLGGINFGAGARLKF